MRSLIVLLIALTGCESPVAIEVFDQRPASESERQWAGSVYATVAECLGLTDYHLRARYWSVSEIRNGDSDHPGAQVRDDIYIVGELTVRYQLAHEIMHHALWRNTGDSDPKHMHPDWFNCTVW